MGDSTRRRAADCQNPAVRTRFLVALFLLIGGCASPEPQAEPAMPDKKPTISDLDACKRLFGKDGEDGLLTSTSDRMTDAENDTDFNAALQELIEFGSSAPKPLDGMVADQAAGFRAVFGSGEGDIDASMDATWKLFHTCNPLLIADRKKSERAASKGSR